MASAAVILLLQCTVAYAAIPISGEVKVNRFADPGAVRIAFTETDFQGLSMSIETAEDEEETDGALTASARSSSTAQTSEEQEQESVNLSFPNIPYQKMGGVVDCVNLDTGDDNVVIVSGTVQVTANELTEVSNNQFQVGDRFLTAMYGGEAAEDGSATKDEMGELSNLGPQQEGHVDTTDCLYFKASDFQLMPVASGHIRVQK